MKTILCYGDSNTWGSQGSRVRFEHAVQWPNVLANLLGGDFCVVQEGLSARVAGDFDRDDPARNGKDYFEVAFRTAVPVDLVIVALGGNDLKRAYGRTAQNIADDLLWYPTKIEALKGRNSDKMPKVLYITAANFHSDKDYYDADEAVRQEAIAKLEASGNNVIALNDLELVEDGLHYNVADHQRVAKLVEEKVKELL